MKYEPNSGRLIAIGDIHGHSRALAALVAAVRITSDDTVIVLGDCVNRGPDSRGVLEQLLELECHCKLICILGNHDETMRNALGDPRCHDRWMHMGGEETLMSYGNGDVRHIPESHRAFLQRFVSYFETDRHIFVHANYQWDCALSDQPRMLRRWLTIDDAPPLPHQSGKRVILGHQPGPIRDQGHYTCIDTGCGFGGILSALEANSDRVWHVDEVC